MSGQDAPLHEMPEFARQARLSQEQTELALDMLLDGMPLPPEAPSEMSALPPMLAELSGPAGPSELAGEAAALSRFRRHLSPAGISSRRTPERRMPSWQSPARRAQRAAAVAVAAIGLGGTAAAYAGVLPGPVQELAHHYMDAPATSPASRHPGQITRKAPHRQVPPPDGRGPARADGPTGQQNHAAEPAHPVKPASQDPRNPHHAGWPGHGIPPGQRGKTSPRTRGIPPGHQQVPPGQQVPPEPREHTGQREHTGYEGQNPSAPARGSRFKSQHSASAGHAARPGHPAPRTPSTGHGHGAHRRPGLARPRTT